MRTMIGICPAKPGRRTFDGRNGPTSAVWFDSWQQLAGLLSEENRTLRNLEGYGLVKMHRSTDTSAVHPEALASEFLVVLD